VIEMKVDKAFQFVGGYAPKKDDWGDGAWLAVIQDGYVDFVNPNHESVLGIDVEHAKELFAKLLGALTE